MRYEVEITNIFDKWLTNLKDKIGVNRILARMYRVEQGDFGDVKSVGHNLFEMRFFFGPGYRVYYTVKERTVVLLLCGGDKSSQDRDIIRAKAVMAEVE